MLRTALITAFSLTALSGTALAGDTNAYTSVQDQGVQVIRGVPSPAAYQQMAARQNAAAQRAALYALKAQNRQLTAQNRSQAQTLSNVKAQLAAERAKAHQKRKPRRRVYYGNNRFFGPNGFVGNRYHGGGTIILSPRPYYRRYPSHR